MPVKIEEGVEVIVAADQVNVKGPLGELKVSYPKTLKVSVNEGQVLVERINDEKKVKSIHGTVRVLISNAIKGVKTGYEKRLEVVGVGYRVRQDGDGISLSLGLTHPVIFKPIAGIQFIVEGENLIIIKGADKQAVGEMAAKIREVKKPEPYKGKGIRYEGEHVRRKSAKAVAK